MAIGRPRGFSRWTRLLAGSYTSERQQLTSHTGERQPRIKQRWQATFVRLAELGHVHTVQDMVLEI